MSDSPEKGPVEKTMSLLEKFSLVLIYCALVIATSNIVVVASIALWNIENTSIHGPNFSIGMAAVSVLLAVLAVQADFINDLAYGEKETTDAGQ